MNILKRGSRGNDVKQLQTALGLYPDGIFGVLTEEAVKVVQKQKGLKVDGIVGAKTWAAIGVKESDTNATGLKKSRRNITEIIVHCTATPEGRHVTVDQVRAMHKHKGWSDIGYHYLIYLDGSIHVGRDVNLSGAHCTDHNYCSIGVCYVGGTIKNSTKIAKDTRTEAQKAALLSLLKKLKTIYPKASIHSHKDFANKACPSFDATKEYANI